MAEEEVGFRLALKNRREVQHGVHQVGDEFDRVGDEAERAGRRARIGARGIVSFGNAGKVAGRAAVYGIGAVSAAVVGAGIVLTKLSKDSIGEAREAQKVGAISRAEIKATGRAANISAKGVSNLSGAISAKVGIDDEAIQAGANMVLTFKNVRNEVGKGNKIFNRATRDAVDLSAAGFGSIISQSKTLAIALNDPEKGMAKLAKAGVTFTDQQKAQVATFVKQGDLLSAQKLILKEVEGQVGGVAKAQATWGEKASVSIGNIKERLGTALLPLLDRTQRWFVQEGGPALDGYVGVFERRGIPAIEKYAGLFEDRGIPAMKHFYDEAKPVAESILPAIGTGFSTIADATRVIAPRMKSIFDGFNDLPDWAKQSIIIGAGGAAIGKKLGAGGLLGKGAALGGLTTKYGGTPVYVTNPGFGTGGLGGVGGKVGGGKLPGGALLPGLLTTIGLGAGVTYASKDSHAGDNANPTNVGSYADFKRLTAEKDAYQDWWETATKSTRGINEHTRGVIAGIDQVDSKVGKAKNSTQQLLNVLTGVDTNWRPTLEVVGLDSALAKTNAVRTNLLGMPALGSPGAGLGVLAPSGGGKRGGGKGGGVAPRQAFPNVDAPTYSDDFFGGTGSASQRIEVPLIVNGRELGRAVLDDMETRMADR